MITASSDGTARCYDMASGRVMTTYVDHTDIVTCVGTVGKPDFASDAPEFQVVTGSADKTICIFNGKVIHFLHLWFFVVGTFILNDIQYMYGNIN